MRCVLAAIFVCCVSVLSGLGCADCVLEKNVLLPTMDVTYNVTTVYQALSYISAHRSGSNPTYIYIYQQLIVHGMLCQWYMSKCVLKVH